MNNALLQWVARSVRRVNAGTAGAGIDGPVRRGTAHKIELKTRYGSVMTDWWNLSPKTLLTMSSAFIRPGVADDPDREWLCAIFAAATGQKEAADRLATEAAATKPQFRDLLPRFFPAARK